MEKECCQIKVTELDNGYRIEITGEDVKEKCNCCQILQQCFGIRQKPVASENPGCC